MVRSQVGRVVGGLVGAAVLGGLAAAIPPRPHDEVVWQFNRDDLEFALHDCSSTIASDGGFGAVRITVEHHGKDASTAAVDKLFGIKDKFRGCISEHLAAAKLERLGKTSTSLISVAVGDPAAILPDKAFEAWQRAIDRHDRRAITALLPSYMTLSPRGCIRVAGPEVLNDAFVRWTRRLAPRGLNTQTAVLEPIGDDWWFDSAYGVNDGGETHEEICLEHLAPAGSAVRDHIEGIDQAGYMADLQAEYTVDRDGKVIGEIGVCLTTEASGRLSDDELAERRHLLETTVRRIDHHKRSKLERVVLHGRPDKPLEIRVEPATAPLAKGSSRVESGCDASSALVCSRPREDFAPSSFDRAAVDRCVAAAHTTAQDVALACDISNAGTIKNLRMWSTSAPGAGGDPPHLAPSLAACLTGVLAKTRFPPSKGGACNFSIGLDNVQAPP